jgi:uncharacterized protein with HEPN domain
MPWKLPKTYKQFTAGFSLEEYGLDRRTKAAVERKFEIIGEALNRIKNESPETLERIREASKIISFRNVIIHGYDTVSDPILWDVAQTKLPLLIDDIEKVFPG